MIVSEVYWKIVSDTVSVLSIFIEGLYFCRFVKPFLTKNRHIYLIAITHIIIMFIQFIVPFEIRGGYADAIGAAAVFFVMYIMDKRNWEKKVFLAVAFYILEWISWGVLVAVWNISCDIYMLVPAVRESFLLQFVAHVICLMLRIVMEIGIMGMQVKLMHRIYIYKSENITKNELVLMLAPFASFIMGRNLFRYFNDVYEMDLKRYIWEYHHGYNFILLLYQLITFAAMFTVIKTYQNIKAVKRKEKEETILARQMEDMKNHIGEVEELYRAIRSLKHDMKNHVMVLEKLCGKNEEAGRYVTQLMEQIDETTLSAEIKSGNPVTDIIIREKQKEAKEKGIDFQYEFHYPDNSKLNAFDVSVILNNAINNAIEAAIECENAYIRLSSYRKDNAYMIEIKNSFVGKREIDENSGLPFTTKSGEGHGFGLANIRKMSQKYFGDIEIGQSEQEFSLVVMMMIE
ncbi:MAG: sensor histidine kinase [Lachnospiraceae bacterium]|nr:sensor histidine kinase [Lachnospiraceae bacterium]